MSERTAANMDRRKASGRFYTPRPVVQYIVRQSLDRLPEERRKSGDLRILEPACGEGIFLQEAHCYLQTGNSAELASAEQILYRNLFGLDRDPGAVVQTRRTLAALVATSPVERERIEAQMVENIRCGDALIGPDFDLSTPVTADHPMASSQLAASGGDKRPLQVRAETASFDWNGEFASILQSSPGGFDAVIGNPPYVNIRLLTRYYGQEVKTYLRRRFGCARGAYDLYVLFFELAWRLLRPGGICGMIVPNKLATLDYARNCRSLLLRDTTLLQITDLARCRVFPQAGVYPYIVIWQKQTPPPGHRIGIVQVDALETLAQAVPTRGVLQRDLCHRRGWHLHGTLDVESRVPTRPLGELAEVHSGTTGFQAESIARRLHEWSADSGQAGFEFVVTGNVDRYVIRPGAVRFIKRRFVRPVLPVDTVELSERKRALYRRAKILVAGMSKRLEAAWDLEGRALGVQLYALVPEIDPGYLLAVLNSKLMSHLFRLRFQAKLLAGDYLSVNKSQLAALPIRVLDHGTDDRGRRQQLADLAAEMTRLSALYASDPGTPLEAEQLERRRAIDREIDACVY
ncbi:MAG: Eco57I restriction-modification methylase domain-containing protein, partial [Planctomycetes bacterium]|nr:Eco57I restriction-modification methylase domain-containing protein [Planctomycetota bacterium]